MDVPGEDLLDVALNVITNQALTYYQFNGRTLSDVGTYITSYQAPITLFGSFQTIPRQLYERLGLDFNKEYSVFYCSKDFIDVTRDVSGDYLNYGGSWFQLLSNSDWFKPDGWKGALVVLTPKPPEIT
jgi:hypothetical protein